LPHQCRREPAANAIDELAVHREQVFAANGRIEFQARSQAVSSRDVNKHLGRRGAGGWLVIATMIESSINVFSVSV
jgi:hypothetical protein